MNGGGQNDSRIAVRGIVALLLPPLAAALVWSTVGQFQETAATNLQGTTAVILGSIAVVSLVLGLWWYGSKDMGLRGGRPLTAGIGFAALAWVLFIVLRFIFVAIMTIGSPNGTRTYIYLLLFEAFAAQLWTFGLLFRAMADWRGGLTAAVFSGILFGLLAAVYFQEAFVFSGLSVSYFIAWGILYGVIRLRTGSLLGAVLVQSVSSFTTWVVLRPELVPSVAELNNLYVLATVAYMIIIWRLWPKGEADYRI